MPPGKTSPVSIIIPCYNEEKTIALLLEAVYQQTYPRNLLEVVIADGGSNDATRERISEFQRRHPDLLIQVLDNPKRIIPSALNLAIRASRGDIIVRLDAHSVPANVYVARCVDLLQDGAGDNVGGVWEIQPGSDGWIPRSIAAAAANRLGVGDARYRYSRRAGEVDTVPFGAFFRSTFERLGGFDETLLTNEDYEFNTRIRQSGGKVYLDPAIRCAYFARSSLVNLARQYWRYGFWKWRMLRRYPQSLRWRQALPPLFVLGMAGLALAGLFLEWARLVFGLVVIAYLLILAVSALPAATNKRDPALLAGIPLAIATMHFSWGAGFLFSMTRSTES
ncbi:MAG: glycosyltransferase family 2 protein [Chloroflexota bacterium]